MKVSLVGITEVRYASRRFRWTLRGDAPVSEYKDHPVDDHRGRHEDANGEHGEGREPREGMSSSASISGLRE
jgi:hypothetical protein